MLSTKPLKTKNKVTAEGPAKSRCKGVFANRPSWLIWRLETLPDSEGKNPKL